MKKKIQDYNKIIKMLMFNINNKTDMHVWLIKHVCSKYF